MSPPPTRGEIARALAVFLVASAFLVWGWSAVSGPYHGALARAAGALLPALDPGIVEISTGETDGVVDALVRVPARGRVERYRVAVEIDRLTLSAPVLLALFLAAAIPRATRTLERRHGASTLAAFAALAAYHVVIVCVLIAYAVPLRLGHDMPGALRTAGTAVVGTHVFAPFAVFGLWLGRAARRP